MIEGTKAREFDGNNAGCVLRKVRCMAQADSDALKVTLFRGADGEACGWYIGPLVAHDGRMSLPYLPRSRETRASVAVVRAIGIANETCGTICLVDPDDLWDLAWHG